MTKALVQDHLSPVIATLLSRDILLRTPATPGVSVPMRGQALLDSWDDALAEAIDPNYAMTDPSKQIHPLAMPLDKLDGGITPKPRVFFNTTDADTGKNEWFSNCAASPDGSRVFRSSFEEEAWAMHHATDSCEGPSHDAGSDVSVGQAVLHSARFPIVSPAGAYKVNNAEHRLVDGGYADNSGAQTLAAEVAESAHATFKDDIVLLDINGNPPDHAPKKRQPSAQTAQPQMKASPFPTSVLALLQARSAHAENAVVILTTRLPKCIDSHTQKPCVPIQLSLERMHNVSCDAGTASEDKLQCKQVEKARTAPLGWYTGSGASTLVLKSSKIGAGQICGMIGMDCSLPELADGDGAVRVAAGQP